MLRYFGNSLIKNKLINGSLKKESGFFIKSCYSTQDAAEEVRIPVPWGHIAGKWWGKKEGIPIIGIHGWQDNAGSYDKLIPHLKVSNFLAVDLPGHGFSSHFPPGKVYTFLEYICSIRRVVDHFKWERYGLMGHSLGSALAFAYSAIYKDEVECLISLECGRYILLAFTEDFPKQLARGIDKSLEYDERQRESTTPEYTFQEAISVLMEGSLGSVTSTEAASTLLKRGATKQKSVEKLTTKNNKKTDLDVFLQHELSKNYDKSISEINRRLEDCHKSVNKLTTEKSGMEDTNDYLYKLTKDPRVKMLQFGLFNLEIWDEMAKNILCPVLSLEGDEGFLKFGSEELYKKGNDIVKNHSKHFERHVVKGNHHLHLNNPENAAFVINNFFKKIR